MQCPVCRADNTAGPQCRRCRADLSLLWELEEQRGRALAQAGWRLALGDAASALACADAADACRHDADAQRLLAAGRLLERDFAAAWQAYQNARGPLTSG